METRKIQSIGGSSFSIVLPKKWIDAEKLKDKAEVEIRQQKSGSLILSPAGKKAAFKKIAIDGLAGESLYREIISLYILGFDEIKLTAKTISLQQRQVVRSVMQKLMGMEIIEDSGQTIRLKNFLNAEKFSFREHIERMFLMAKLMFTDAATSFFNHNRDLAADVQERDFEVDKIFFLISRVKYSLMLNTISEEQVSSSLPEANYYENIATQLERAADHAVKIAKVAESGKSTINPRLEKILKENVEKITSILKEAEGFTTSRDKHRANHTLSEIEKIFEQSQLVYEEAIKHNFAPALILNDSLNRIAGYAVNMAEFTLAQAIIEDKG